MVKEVAQQRQQDQGDGQGIQEHQHRHSVGDDGGQAHVGQQEGNAREHEHPIPVGQALGEHPHEGLRAAGDKAHRRFQAGQRYGGSQHQQARLAQIVLGDLCQRRAAVGSGFQRAPAPDAHQRHQQVDHAHQQAAKNTGADGGHGHGFRLFHTQTLDHLHYHDTEGKACQGVHGVIALQKAGEEGLCGISTLRLHRADAGGGMQDRHEHHNRQEHQEAGSQDLAHISEDLARPQRKDQRHSEKQQREQQQVEPALVIVGQDLLQTHGEGSRCAPGNGEKRPDGQIKGAGKKERIGTAHLMAEVKKAVATADAQSGHAQQRQTHAGDQEAKNGRPHVPSGHLSHINRENQVSCAEEHAEQHTGHIDVFFKTQFLLHGSISPPRVSSLRTL